MNGSEAADLSDFSDPELVHAVDLRTALDQAKKKRKNSVLQVCRPKDALDDFAGSVSRGLSQRPRSLDCRFLYDAKGSMLYEEITAQPEYYLTRTEAAILEMHARSIAAITGPVTLLELGSGASVKTRHLLRVYAANPAPCYIPIDICESALREASRTLTNKLPAIQVIGIHAAYEDALPLLPRTSPAMVLFLGSTVGNMAPEEERGFFSWLAHHMPANDFFLLGIDLVKEVDLIEAAYNDAAGVTAAFTTNYFMRMNRELGSKVDTTAVRHLAAYNESRQQIEIYAAFSRTQKIFIAPRGEVHLVGEGEKILMEISRKFLIEERIDYFSRFNFKVREVFIDPKQWFALLLLQKGGVMA